MSVNEIDPETGLVVPRLGEPSTGAIVEPLAGHTAKGYPYAQGGDALTDWPATSLELANLLDARDVIGWSPIAGILAGNWQSHPSYPASYSKDRLGVVRTRGLIQWLQGVTFVNLPMLQPPVGYRSPVVEYLPGWCQAGPCNMVVNGASVTVAGIQHDPGAGYAGFWVSLSALSWVTT